MLGTTRTGAGEGTMSKPRIYLAGPISGCNEDQRTQWRREVRRGFGEEFDFVDPTDNLIGREQSDYEVVAADAEAIRACDAVLANMWRESIGTAFGILHAHSAGRVVVVNDPNFVNNRMVTFYADAVERTLPASLNAIRKHLLAQSRILGVEKRDGTSEPFSRQKLASAVRKACLDAGESDLAPPHAIVTQTLSLLLAGSDEARVVPSAEIRDRVWEALALLAADPAVGEDYDQIRRAWDRHEDGKPREAPASPAHGIFVSEKPLETPVHTVGNHSMIWGHRIGADAARIFAEIVRVNGITEVVFGPFKNTGNPPRKPHVRLVASKTPTHIEGTCYDKGPKGTLQTFQIRVADPDQRDTILKVVRDHLVSLGHVRPGPIEVTDE